MTLGYTRSGTDIGFKGHRLRSQCVSVSSFCILEPCILHSSTFARWRNKSSAWVRNWDRTPAGYSCVTVLTV